MIVTTIKCVSLFLILWVMTICVYSPKVGVLMAAKLGILTSVSKTGVARGHHWICDKIFKGNKKK